MKALQLDPEKLMYLRRFRLNTGGYDRTGRYWGVGQPLFEYQNEADTEYGHIRADDREHAKAKLEAKYPGVVFAR